MLQVIMNKSYALTLVKREENSLIMQSERGLLRVKPQTDSIARISYTEKESFSPEVGVGINNEQSFADWTFSETDTEVKVALKCLHIYINKNSGSIKYCDQNGKLLLAERDHKSHELNEFMAMKTVVDENTKIEEIDTPDGVKRIIKSATTVFDKDLYQTKLHFNFADDEQIFGLGQHEEGVLDMRGTTQYLHQANLKIAIPVMLSTAGYGLLFATGSTAIFEDTQYGSYFYTEADEEMDFYFMAGKKFDEIVSSYRFMTGKAVMLPRWAFGFMQSQERYETQQEILEITQGYRDRKIGIDSIVLDWRSWVGEQWGQKTFDPERFPDPAQMIKDLHANDTHFMISVWPNMREMTDNYREFLEAKLLLPANNMYDPFKPKARDLYWKQANEGLFSKGVDAWWCDSCEPVAPEWRGPIKPTPAKMYETFLSVATKYMQDQYCNAYGIKHSQTIYDGQRSVTDKKRVTNLTRNSYTGGQRHGAILWSGDTAATWETLKNQIVAGLNFCATGLPYWTLDIGAFFVVDGDKWFRTGDYNAGLADYGYRELFVRWFQYGAFLPVFRSHGTDIRREMWLFDDENNHDFYNALVKANQLRYTLIPYIYSLAAKVYFDDYTIMRLLAFDFAHDRKATKIKDQYMFGDIMVCPITTPMYYGAQSTVLVDVEKSREVYLPAGQAWFDYYTGQKYEGGQTIKAEAKLDTMPLYVKAGSILVKTQPLQSTAEVVKAQLEIHVYQGQDASFNLYEDEGDGYGYEKGEYTSTSITWSQKAEKLEISANAERFTIVMHK